jgi:hypothetical protein
MGGWKLVREVTRGASHTLILRWDGTRWSQVPSPNLSSYNYLLGVDAVSPADAWAVGYKQKDGYKALTAR